MNNNTFAKNSRKTNETVELRHYFGIIWRYKWKILTLVAAVVAFTVWITLSMENIYSASTTVLIESEQAKIVSIDEVYGGKAASQEYLLTQFEILKSRELSERVVKRLDLVNNPLFELDQPEAFNISELLQKVGLNLNGSDPVEQVSLSQTEVLNRTVRKFREALSISPVRNTQLVSIKFESRDPELAAKVTDTLAQEYISGHLEAKLSVTVEAADWLTERLEGLQATLRESEQRLQSYREEAGLVDVSGVQTLDASELTELTQRLVAAANARSSAETAFRQVQQLGGDPTAAEYLSIPDVSLDPLVQVMREAQTRADRRVAELANRYGPKHPKMIAARSDAEQALGNLRQQVERVARGMETKYQGALQTERSIQSQINEAKQRFQAMSRKEFKLLELEREVAANRQMHDLFLTRAKETNQAEGLQTAHARIVDPAVIPQEPIKPKKKMIVVVAVVVSGMLGVMMALFAETFNNTLRTPEEVEDRLGLPVFGFLPLETKNKSKLPMEGFTQKSKGVFAESIRTIRTAFVLSGLERNQKLTIVTSSIPGEGKSTVALNLARALSQVEKVLLIDADMRRPTLSRVLDLPKGSPGLSNWIAGTANSSDIIYKMDDWDVDVIPSGVIPHNPLELISSKRFQAAFEKLKSHYDRIIVDSAPVCAVSDALMLSHLADAVIYVCKSDSTKQSLVSKGVGRLREVDAPLVGVILNQVNIKKYGRYGDYYSEYFQNYGYSSEEEFYAQQKYQKSKGDEVPYEQRRVSGVDDI